MGGNLHRGHGIGVVGRVIVQGVEDEQLAAIEGPNDIQTSVTFSFSFSFLRFHFDFMKTLLGRGRQNDRVLSVKRHWLDKKRTATTGMGRTIAR